MLDAMKARLAAAYGAQAVSASIHTADPGTTGANELTTSARQALTWTTAANVATSNAVTFPISGSVTVTHVGIWATDGTFLDSMATGGSVFAGAGSLTLTVSYTQN